MEKSIDNKNLIYVGKIVNTHGIKGELRIISNFEFKDKVFIPGVVLYIGDNREKHIIRTYRHHKNFEMVTLDEFDNINDVLYLKGSKVYVEREMIKLESNEYLDIDLYGLQVLVNGVPCGVVSYIERNGSNKLVVINYNNREVLIPYNDVFVKTIDLINRTIVIEPLEGMF